ncbi:uncharacterized protein TNCV_4525961 [Trichonephila clavipes]|nr:uncharacterized protein TNCV_4525961 [Trichonephila clavipes]
MPVPKVTEVSLDVGCEKYAAPEMFTGEHASIKHILDDGMTCLQPAERKIECEPVHVVSKPVVSPGHLNGGKYFLEDQTIELLEPDSEQNGLPRPEIGNDTQTRRQRKKEAEKSTRLENENDPFRLRECVVENGEDFVPSFTGEGTDNGNLVKILGIVSESSKNRTFLHQKKFSLEERGVVANVVPGPQQRMVLLPEEVGEKGFLESRSPTFRIDSSGKDMRRTDFEGPDWRQKA